MQAVYSRGQLSVNLCNSFIDLHHVHEYLALTNISMIQNFLQALSYKVIFLCEKQNSPPAVQFLKSLSESTVS